MGTVPGHKADCHLLVYASACPKVHDVKIALGGVEIDSIFLNPELFPKLSLWMQFRKTPAYFYSFFVGGGAG